MKGVGGNTMATIQVSRTTKNEIGESVKAWDDVQTIAGWLDLAGGDSSYTAYSAKVQQSTHVFVADWVPLDKSIKPETSRMLIGGEPYDIMLLDNPMGMQDGSQWEIYLKYTGGR
ncbi:MAG: hypothetical protein ACI4WX_06180 [Aristaeellaceae bacterium]